jgi:hypothetical protein
MPRALKKKADQKWGRAAYFRTDIFDIAIFR